MNQVTGRPVWMGGHLGEPGGGKDLNADEGDVHATEQNVDTSDIGTSETYVENQALPAMFP